MAGNSNPTVGGDSGTGKKRRIDEEEDEPVDTSEEDNSESDEGLTFEDMVERKKKKKAARKKQRGEEKRAALVGELAAGHATPSGSTGLSRALQEWLRFMLGISRKSKLSQDSDMPKSPTDEERKKWMDRKRNREALITQAIEKAKSRYIARKTKKNPKFKANPTQILAIEKDAANEVILTNPLKPVSFSSSLSFTSRSKYTHLWGTKCEGALALAGFPRCTLDWEAGYETPWNSSMSSILIQQWVKCNDGNGVKGFGISTTENTAENRDEVVRRWFTNQLTNYRRQSSREELKKTPDGRKQLEEDMAMEKSKESRRRALTKIHTARMDLVNELFGDESPEAKMVSCKEVHSEDEVTSNSRSATRFKVRKEWRSAELDTFLQFCDTSICDRETKARLIRRAKLITERGTYSSTPDQESRPPKGFQRSLVSPTWLSGCKKLTVISLGLKDHNEVNISKALEHMVNLLQSEGANIQSTQPVASGSRV